MRPAVFHENSGLAAASKGTGAGPMAAATSVVPFAMVTWHSQTCPGMHAELFFGSGTVFWFRNCFALFGTSLHSNQFRFVLCWCSAVLCCVSVVLCVHSSYHSFAGCLRVKNIVSYYNVKDLVPGPPGFSQFLDVGVFLSHRA